MTDEEIIDYILSILNGSKKEAVQMRECVAKTAICLRLNASIEFMQKLNTRLARLKGFESGDVAWQGDMDATIKQNLELKETVSRAGYRIAELKHEIDELKEQNKIILEDNDELNKWIDELKEQIEKLTCSKKYYCRESDGSTVPCFMTKLCADCQYREPE